MYVISVIRQYFCWNFDMLGLFSISSCDYSPHYFGKTRLIFWSSQNNNIFNLAIARANYGENDIRVETRIEKGLLRHFYDKAIVHILLFPNYRDPHYFGYCFYRSTK